MLIGLILSNIFLASCFGVEFQFLNREIGDIWVGIQGNPGHAHLSEGGFVLRPGERVSVHSAHNWAGRFWARTWCNPYTNHCNTGDCGNKVKCNGAGGAPPVSTAEITLSGHRGLDYYDVSLVDGFNIMVAIEPLGGRGDNGCYSCKKAACQIRLNNVCPERLKIMNRNTVIGCNSACSAFNSDQYCCRGNYGTPETCQACAWPENYPRFFKSQCPDAYSYVYDDHKNTFTCRAPAYLVTFGG